MNLDINALKKYAEQMVDNAHDLLLRLPDDPLDLNRRLAEEIVYLGVWLLTLIDAIPEDLK